MSSLPASATAYVLRTPLIDPELPTHVLESARAGVFDDVYVLVDGERPRWQVVVSWGEHRDVPFREQMVWALAGVVVIGGGAAVYFLDLATGASRHRLDLPCRFGHLALDPGEAGIRPETLYVLGWTDAIAIAPSLETRWWARDLAVDGIVFHEAAGALISLGVEMDPPGGWFAIEVEAATGREVSRKEDFSQDYIGIYGRGSP